ncbi:hypothetical protein MACK_002308 [Theileria orientalis]|uniref:Uncharacterized protein n=1 Tax=Theileria orientalis TaxID=68886 RepID=A0A976MBV1_THEOR|nr:hypothetical protein MACK_002308 [Theileria orientalis]
MGNEMSQFLTRSEEIHEIESSFKVDVKAIVEMGENGTEIVSIIGAIKDAASGGLLGDDRIKKAVVQEAWKIYYAGLDNRTKRIERIKELASVMGHKIMDKLYDVDLGSDGAFFDLTSEEPGVFELEMGHSEMTRNYEFRSEEQIDESDSLLNDSHSIEDDVYGQYVVKITNAINAQKDQILEIIRRNAGQGKLADFIKQNSDSISSEIASIKLISRSLKTGLSFGDIKDAVNRTLRAEPTQIASQIVSGELDVVANQVFGAIAEHKKKTAKADINEKDKALEQIRTTIVRMVPQAIIEENSGTIAEEIVKIESIAQAIETPVTPEGVQLSLGLMRASIQYILIKEVELIQSVLSVDSSEQISELVKAISSELYSCIYNAKFGLVISGIITDNADEIAGRSKHYGPSADTIQENVQKKVFTEIIHGFKRRRYMLVALADSIAHSIVKRLGTIEYLQSSILNIMSQSITEIILENVGIIAGYASDVITETTIQSNVQKYVKKRIAYKIEEIRYKIGKSVVVDLTNQQHCGQGYEVIVVDNKPGSAGLNPVTGGGNFKIQVKKLNCSGAQPTLKEYTCYTHTIPNLTGSTEYPLIGRLKLYICQNHYLSTYDKGGSTMLPIYYDPNDREVKVYFYCNGGTSRENPDKVPLLAEYNGNHYKPSSRDGYFTQWVLIHDIGTKSQITSKLDEINKILNEVDISHTSPTSYGLTKPKQAMQGLNQNFCDRITVKRENSHSEHYLMVTHSTDNKGPVGDFYTGKTKISGIKLDSSTRCNKVEVYYRATDIRCNNPLLVCITSQNLETGSAGKKWFSRSGVDVTRWNENKEHWKFETPAKIKEQLDSIYGRMSNYLFLDIYKQSEYSGLVQQGTKDIKKPVGTIVVVKGLGEDTYKPKNYRYYKHVLSTYYTSNKEDVSKFDLKDQGDNITLQLRIQLDKNNYLYLLGKDGVNLLTTPLTYGNRDSGNTNKDPYVYFFESTRTGSYSDNTDKVPLILKFGEKYFGPIDKENYFKTWKEYDLNTYNTRAHEKDKIKVVLNKITRLLNLIDLQQTTTDYGDIERPGEGSHNPLGARKRVSVTKGNLTEYNTVIHSTANTGCVGTVYYGDQELLVVQDQGGDSDTKWSQYIETEIGTGPRATDIYNTLTAYYHHSDINCKKPLLIGISGTETYDLYYERKELADNYKWVKVTEDLKGHQIIDKVNKIFYDFTKSIVLQVQQRPTICSIRKQYELKLVKNYEAGTPDHDHGSGRIEVENDKKCSVGPSYKCIKHTISMNVLISSEVSGIRFYLGDDEIETFKDLQGREPISVFYQQGKNDIHIYLQDKGNVPLMFLYNTQFFKPMSKSNYFKKWVIDTSISNNSHPQPEKLDSINTMLNEVDLQQTGNGGSGGQYGLEKPRDATGLDKFNENRITVTQDAQVTGDSKSTYVTVTHTTVNGHNIGSIKALGSCKFDNQHTQTLADKEHNKAVAVYASGYTNSLQNHNPKLVLICSTSGLGSGGKSTVLGYYNLSNVDEGKCGEPYKFKMIESGFNLDEITSRETIQVKCASLVAILESIGVLAPEAQVNPALSTEPVTTEALGSEEDNLQDEELPDTFGQQERQDDRPKVSLLGGDSDGLGGSPSVDLGAKASDGDPGSVGPAGKDGLLQPFTSDSHTEPTASSSTSDHSDTSATRLKGQELRTLGDGGGPSTSSGSEASNRRTSEGGENGTPRSSSHEEGPNRDRGEAGSPGPTGPSGDKGNLAGGGGGSSGSDAASSSKDFGQQIKEAFESAIEYAQENPGIVGGGGAAAGVGVIGTAGAVIYKKCIVGSAVAAGKAAAKVAAAAASGM